MDINRVQTIIQQIFSDITPPDKRLGELECQWIIDTTNHHYQVLMTGWEGVERVHDVIVQIDIKGDLIWVQQDNTDYGVADALVKAGIPKEQIVLGFHSPFTRPLTGFAVG